MTPSIYEINVEKALPDITKYFNVSHQKVYTQSDLSKILSKNRIQWHLYIDIPIRIFIKILCGKSIMKKVELLFGENISRKETRYLWGDASVYEFVLSLKTRSYLTHHTAAYLHGLTNSEPLNIYLNSEQSKRTSTGVLSQAAIDLAFKNPVRISNNKAQYGNNTIYLLNGMYTGHLGVVELIGDKGDDIHLSGIERTLIDISVRPVYSGGVLEVLNTYRVAYNKISVQRLFEIYKKMNYIYPYHQVIGYYLDMAGLYKDNDINLFHNINMPFNFYLIHNMAATSFSEKWRLFYPKELDIASISSN